MCVWSGFSLGGIYGTQIVRGEFSLAMSLFGIPFIMGTVLMGSHALMTLCGKVEVAVENGRATVFTGIGSLGSRQRFLWDGVGSLRTTLKPSRKGGTSEQITLEGTTRVDFGSRLNAERLHFVLSALKQMRREQG